MTPPDATLDISNLVTDDVPALAPANDRFELVNEYHNLARLSMAQSCAYMVLAGVELLALKKQTKHGDWEGFFEGGKGKSARACVFGMSVRTAQKYMGLAAGAKKNVEELQRLCSGDVALSQMALEDREKVIKAVRKVADGSTYQQLAFEWDLAKKPLGSGARGGHHPAGGGNGSAPPPPLEGDTPEEQSAIGIWKPIIADLEEQGMTKDSWADLPNKYRAKLKNLCIDLGKRIPAVK